MHLFLKSLKNLTPLLTLIYVTRMFAEDAGNDAGKFEFDQFCVRVFETPDQAKLPELKTEQQQRLSVEPDPRRVAVSFSPFSGRAMIRHTQSYQTENGDFIKTDGKTVQIEGHYRAGALDKDKGTQYITSRLSPIMSPSGRVFATALIDRKIIEHPVEEDGDDEPGDGYTPDIAEGGMADENGNPSGAVLQTVLEIAIGNLDSMLKGKGQTSSVVFVLDSIPYIPPKISEPSHGPASIASGFLQIGADLYFVAKITRNALSRNREVFVSKVTEDHNGNIRISEDYQHFKDQDLSAGFFFKGEVYHLQSQYNGTVGGLEIVKLDDLMNATNRVFADVPADPVDFARGRKIQFTGMGNLISNIEGENPVQTYPGRFRESPLFALIPKTGHLLVWEWPNPPNQGSLEGLSTGEAALVQKLLSTGVFQRAVPKKDGVLRRPENTPFLYVLDFKTGQKRQIQGIELLITERDKLSLVVINNYRAWLALNDGRIYQLDLKENKMQGQISLSSKSPIDDVVYDKRHNKLMVVLKDGTIDLHDPL